jgi:simple sugar transport system permease protein
MRISARARSLAQPLLALLAAFAIAAFIIASTCGEPFPKSLAVVLESFTALFRGAFGDTNGLLRSLAKSTPLLFSGLAVAVALRAGLFNIGAEGQLLVGGLAAAWAGFAVKGLPIYIHLPLAMAAGAASGAAWAAVPGVLRAYRGAHEVIVTIMMNYVAIHFTHYLVNGPLRDTTTRQTATPSVLPTAQLWSLPGSATNFSAGFFLALIAAAAVAFLLRRTALGFEIRAVGLGPDAARAAGISVPRTMVASMCLSGALAGLAGAVEVLGVHHRFLDQFSPGYGFDSIAVALLGNLNASGVTLAALLFGGLKSGANEMYTQTQIPIMLVGVIQSVVILAIGIRRFRRRRDA